MNQHPLLQKVINNYIIQRSLHDYLCSTMCICLNLVWLEERKIKYLSKLKQEHSLYVWCHHLFLFYRIKLCKYYLDAVTFSAPVFVLVNLLFPFSQFEQWSCIRTHSMCFHLIFCRPFLFGSFIFPYPLKPSTVIQFTTARPSDRDRNNQLQALLIPKSANKYLMILIILCSLD